MSILSRKYVNTFFPRYVSHIDKGLKTLSHYISLIAVVLCLVNLLYLSKIDSDLKDLDSLVQNIDADYDNSDVIYAIENAESNIEGSIEDAQDNLRRNIILWGN